MLTTFLRFGTILIFYLVVGQDLLASILYRAGSPAMTIKGLVFLKEILVVSMGSAVFIMSRKISKVRLYLLLLICYSLPFLFIGDLTIYLALVGFRMYVLLFFCFVIGERLSSDSRFQAQFMKHLNVLLVFIVLFAFAEYFILPANIWKTYFPILEMKRNVLGLVLEEYFNTGLPVNAFGEIAMRMVGPFNDPLTLAYFSMLALNFFVVSALSKSGRRRWFISTIGVIMLLMTQTRAVILGFVISVVLFLTKDYKIKKLHLQLAMMLVAILPVFVFVFWDWVAAFTGSIFSSGGRNVGHLAAYTDGIKSILSQPWGHGIGSSSVVAGFAAKNLSTENAFLNIGIEIGLLGLAIFLAAFLMLWSRFANFIKVSDPLSPRYIVVASAYMLLIQYMFAGLVAPHILIAKIMIPFFIILGWAYGLTTRPLEPDHTPQYEPIRLP